MFKFPRKIKKEQSRKAFYLSAVFVFLGLIAPGHFASAFLGEDTIMSALVGLFEIIFKGSALFMSWMGEVFDISVSYTIDSAIYKSVSGITVGWTAVRDMSNMFFIFVLLYISILTILNMAGSSTKRWVAHLIIAALLINFSLFATQVVVDAGNILAIGFWNKIVTKQVGGADKNGASAFFMEGFRVQTEFDKAVDSNGNKLEITPSKKMFVFIGGTLVNAVAGYVFLAGAIMMIIRSVWIMMLMIASPFAFLGFALPKGGGFASEWLSKLIGVTFMAPALVFMLYVDALIIRGTGAGPELMRSSGADKDKWIAAFSGSTADFAIFYNFALIIMLLLAALTISQRVSGGVGKSAGGWAKKTLGTGGGLAIGGVAIGAGIAGRQVGGRIGKSVADSKWAQRLAKSDGWARQRFGNLALATGEKMKKGTWDARNTGVVGTLNKGLGMTGTGVTLKAGSGSTKSYDTHGGVIVGAALAGATAAARVVPGVKNIVPQAEIYKGSKKEDEILKTANERYKKNPSARENYLKRKLGARYESDKFKDSRSEIERAKTTSTAIDNIKDRTKEMKDMDDTARAQHLATDILDKNGQKIGKTIGQEIINSIKTLNGKEFVDLGEDILKNKFVHENANNVQLAAVQAKVPEFKDQNLASEITKNVLDNGTESGKKYMRNQISQGTSNFNYDYKDALRSQITAYDAAKTANDATALANAKAEMSTIVGRIDSKDVASLDEDFHTHEAVVATYKKAHIAAIQKRQKEQGDFNDSFIEEFHKTVQTGNSDAKVHDVMDKALKNKESGLFNTGIAEAKRDDIQNTLIPRAEANRNAQTPNSQAYKDADALVKKLERERNDLTKALT